ncbi:MAG: serine protein kinase RIO [Candidatus Hodarchaeales archaeon]
MKFDDKKFYKKIDNKERHQEKKKKRAEDFQTVNSVIDLKTTQKLKKLQSSNFLKRITGTIASGKESGVFLAELGSEGIDFCKKLSINSPIVVKIYRTSTLNFKKIVDYISGDVRFSKRRKKIRYTVNLWAEKEYKNLLRSKKAGVNVPKPILVKDNILLMELIGQDGVPAPLLRLKPDDFTERMFTSIIDQVKVLFREANLVHADLSPYNIIIKDQKPFFIDMSQSVLVSHPRALEFLNRDIKNLLASFSYKSEINQLQEKIIKYITKESEEKVTIISEA